MDFNSQRKMNFYSRTKVFFVCFYFFQICRFLWAKAQVKCNDGKWKNNQNLTFILGIMNTTSSMLLVCSVPKCLQKVAKKKRRCFTVVNMTLSQSFSDTLLQSNSNLLYYFPKTVKKKNLFKHLIRWNFVQCPEITYALTWRYINN